MSFLCVDCNIDTSTKYGGGCEYYMVHDHIWPIGKNAGMLCVGCLEDRIGRKLTPSDFADSPLNAPGAWPRSQRLRERLGEI